MKARSFQHSLHLLILGTFLIATGSISAQCVQPYSCGDVLRGPAYNRLKVSSAAEADNKFSSEFCEGTSAKSLETIKADTSGNYALIFSGSFGFDETRFYEAVRKFCSSQSGETKNHARLELMSEVVNKEIYDKWLECIKIKETSPGLKADLDFSESTDFVFRVRWNPGQGVFTSKVSDFTHKGADCSPLILTKNRLIGPDWISQQCARNSPDGLGEVTISLNVTNESELIIGSTNPIQLNPIVKKGPPPVAINVFKIEPPRIKSGDVAIMSWNVGPASSLKTARIDDAIVDLAGTSKLSPTLPDGAVTPLTLHYTLIVEGNEGTKVPAQADLVVLPLIPINKNPNIAIQEDFSGGKMIACPKGYAIAGAHEDNNKVLCRQVILSLTKAANEIGTLESNNVCPAGTYMRGMFIGAGGSSSRTLCSWNRQEHPNPASAPLQFTKTSTNSLGNPSGDVDEDMHACPQSDSAHFITVITGIDYRKESIFAKPKTTVESFTCSKLRR